MTFKQFKNKNFSLENLDFSNEAEILKSLNALFKLDSQIELWIDSSSDASKRWLAKNRDLIPKELKKGGELFRGVRLSGKTMKKFINTGKLVLDSKRKRDIISSWTRSQKVAKGFAEPGNLDFGIVIKKKIPNKNIVIDFTKYCTEIIKIGKQITKQVLKQSKKLESDIYKNTNTEAEEKKADKRFDKFIQKFDKWLNDDPIEWQRNGFCFTEKEVFVDMEIKLKLKDIIFFFGVDIDTTNVDKIKKEIEKFGI